MPNWLQAVEGGVLVSVYVQPRASKNEIVDEHEGELKLRLTSPPVEGAANKLCCAYVAKRCGLPKRAVTIRSGEKARHKRLLVAGLTLDQVTMLLSPG